VRGRVLVVGSLHVVVRAEVDAIPTVGRTATAVASRRTVGGRGVAQARAARRAGATVALVAAVGGDEAGRWCGDYLARIGVEPLLQVVEHEQTGTQLVLTEAPDREATLLLDRANTALDGVAALASAEDDEVVLVQLDVPVPVVTALLREADRRRLRAVVNASPFAALDAEAASLADPFVVGERDAALLADVGLIPASLCVTFGRAGAVWDGLRMDRDDVGGPIRGAGGTEVFCGTLAAALAAGQDRQAALRQAVLAAPLTDW
jgi:ribokinase